MSKLSRTPDDTLFIAGRAVRGQGPPLPVVDPRTGETIVEIREADPGQLDQAVAAARAAAQDWGWRRTVSERAGLLLRIADAIEAHIDELADLEVLDTGKDRATFLADETITIVDPFRFYAGVSRSLGGLAAGEYVADHTSMIRRDPIGVVGLIAPWNYPLMMAVWKLAPALAAGNTAIVKPAEITPLATLRLAEILAEILPPGVVQVIHGRGETVGRSLVAHPDVDMISLTGDIATGQAVMREAAGGLKRLHLELGGNAPVIVFGDADLEHAASTIAAAGLYNAGQDCTAACRVYAHESVHDRFVEMLARAMDEIPLRQPLISAVHRQRVAGFVERACALTHAQVVRGGDTAAPERGFGFAKTLLAGMQQGDELVQREVFGPVISVTRFSEREQVVGFANDTRYGLSASVWTRDLSTGMSVSRRLQYGCVWVNDHLVWPTEMPHGGLKMSGQGKEMSVYGLEDYTEIRHVMINHADRSPANER